MKYYQADLKTFRLTIKNYTESTAQRGQGSNNSRPYIAALSSGNSWEHKSRFYLSTVILSIVYYDWDPAIYWLADGADCNFWSFAPDMVKFKNTFSVCSQFGEVIVENFGLNIF